jgi:ABC-2 type transport system permease protein
VSTYWRTFKTAAWLGWEMDSNWTEPWLFLIYSIVKPVAAAFILVLMYVVFTILGQTQDPNLFAFMYVGNSFFIFVGTTIFGTFQVIQSDREWYETIRYVYISPISYYVYILGRAFSKMAVSTFAVIITLLFGVAFLGVHISLTFEEIPTFVASFILGLSVLLAIGITLAGVTFLTARHSQGLAEAVPGIFYVFCGVLFPLAVLPGWAQEAGKAIPLTYWFDITRRILLAGSPVNTGLAGYNDSEIMALLLISSILFFLLSLGVFKLGEYLARKAGKIDMLTSY